MRWAILGVVLVALAGCSGAASGPAWTEVPLGAGPTSVALGDLARCAGRWYASGALRRPVPDADPAAGESAVANAPALWSSPDGRTWAPQPVAPVSYYGARQVLTGLACRPGARADPGEIAALGAATGGAHGNPRVSTWRSVAGGVAEVDAPIELYGGPRAVTVTTIAGGSGGWLIAGNRVGADGGPTAAVWLSGDATRFTEHADAPGLAGTPDAVTMARGAVATPGGWLVWGDTRRVDSLVREPALWSSPDGLTWRVERPGPVTADASVSAVGVDGPNGDRVLAMGTLGGVPHAWFRDPGGWVDAGGPPTEGGSSVARVGQVVLTARDAYAAVDDGDHWSVWRSTDLRSWTRVPVPVEPRTGADSRLRVAVSDDLLVVAGSDATGGHLWVAARPG